MYICRACHANETLHLYDTPAKRYANVLGGIICMFVCLSVRTYVRMCACMYVIMITFESLDIETSVCGISSGNTGQVCI